MGAVLVLSAVEVPKQQQPDHVMALSRMLASQPLPSFPETAASPSTQHPVATQRLSGLPLSASSPVMRMILFSTSSLLAARPSLQSLMVKEARSYPSWVLVPPRGSRSRCRAHMQG